jgi:hypothetical protein
VALDPRTFIQARDTGDENDYRAPKITRFEVIDHRLAAPVVGRVFVARAAHLDWSLQDDGRTLKVFVTDGPKP